MQETSEQYEDTKKEMPSDISKMKRAGSGTRTRDLRITNALLYQLSYFGVPHIRKPLSPALNAVQK